MKWALELGLSPKILTLPLETLPFALLLNLCETKSYHLQNGNNAYSLIAQLVKNPPAMQETPVRFLGGEDPLQKG